MPSLSAQQTKELSVAILKLAGAAESAAAAAAALPGATIAQKAAASAHAGGGHGRKVASAQGAAHYKLPIGSLIIPHEHVPHGGGPGEHFIAGAPGHFSHYISEAKWLANQWKGRKHADEAAHAAVESGTHRWVHVGNHQFAVHKGLEVHVPKATDLHDPVAVNNAPKLFVKKGGGSPEYTTVHPKTGPSTSALPYGKQEQEQQEQHWKALHKADLNAPSQKSVSFEGKHAAWVPHDWKVYKSPSTDESKLAGKFAKDPEGKWHLIGKQGYVKEPENADPDSWVASGKLVPDDNQAQDHGIPPAEPGVQPGKKDIGGVAVTKEEMQHAIQILSADKSTAVKQPLAKAGHPLAGMAYHAVAKAELAKHPELKVAPGTKKAHVGQVKLAVLHHLGRHVESMANHHAGEAAAKQAVESAQAEAEHAKDLTPHTITVPKETLTPKEEPSAPVSEVPPETVPAKGKVVLKVTLADGTVHTWEKDKLPQNWKSWIFQHLPYGTDTAGASLEYSHLATPAEAKSLPAEPAKPQGYDKLYFDDSKGQDSWPKYGKSGTKWVKVYQDGHTEAVAKGEKVPIILSPVTQESPPAPEPPPASEPPPAPAGEVQAGGITATKEDVQAAIDALNASGSTAIKQILKAKGNPLANADYWAVIHEYEAAHPVVKAKGTKQKHVGNAKQMFIAALQEKVAMLAQADQLTGHDEAAALYSMAQQGVAKPGWEKDSNGFGALARAAVKAVSTGYVAYGWVGADSQGYSSSFTPPDGVSFYRVTPQLKAYWHSDNGSKGIDAGKDLKHALSTWTEPKDKVPAVPAPAPVAEEAEWEKALMEPTQPDQGVHLARVAKAWKKDPGWDKLHQLVSAIKPLQDLHTIPEAQASAAPDKALARALWLAWNTDAPRYVTDVAGWKVLTHAPEPGSFAANTAGWWEVLPDHQVIMHGASGADHAMSVSSVQGLLMYGVKPATVLDAPPEPSDLVHVTFKGKTYEFPPGTKVYQDKLGQKWVRTPEGKWDSPWQTGFFSSKSPFLDGKVSSGELFEVKPDTPPTIPVWAGGKHVADVPHGSKFYTGTGVKVPLGEATKYVQFPDGSWHQTGKDKLYAIPNPPQIGKQGNADGIFPIPEEAAKGMVAVTAGEYVHWAPRGSSVWSASASGMTMYARHPDGSWVMVDKYDGVSPASPDAFKTYDSWAVGDEVGVHLTPANDAAKQFISASAPKVAPPAKGIEVLPPDPVADVKVHVGEKHAASFPAGTQVFALPSDTSAKYAKKPDGSWWYVYPDGPMPAPTGNNWDKWVAGSSNYQQESHDPGTGEPVKEAAPAPEAAGIPAIYDGEIKGEWPAGSKLYHKDIGSYGGTYAKAPDGKWWKVGAHGVSAAPHYMVSDDMLKEQGVMSEEKPPTPQQIADAKALTELKQAIKNGTVNPGKAIAGGSGGKKLVFPSWQQAALYALASEKKTDGDVTVIHKEGGFVAAWLGNGNDEHWSVNKNTLAASHWVDGSPQHLPLSEMVQAAAQHVVPDTVVVDGKQYAFGYWKKPKGSSYLEIKNTSYNGYNYKYTSGWEYGTAAHATYFYHSSDGSVKQVTPDYAAKYLQGTSHSTMPPGAKPPPAKLTKAGYAQMPEPHGSYKVWSEATSAPAQEAQLTLMPDGSGLLQGPGMLSPHNQQAMTDLLKGGGLLDAHGTTVVRPGTPVFAYHLFGSKAHTPEELAKLKDDMEAHWSTSWAKDFVAFVSHGEVSTFKEYAHFQDVVDWLGTKIDGEIQHNGEGQRQAIYGLVTELLAIPDLPEDAKVSKVAPYKVGEPGATGTKEAKETTFLKTLPPGITKASDIFTFSPAGHAVPHHSGLIAGELAKLTVPELKAKVSEISQKFGDGKVVGTHLTMSKDALVGWLKAWKSGDMSHVFQLDAAAGKVSPAHPGAPDNASTHDITWSALDPGQVPANKDIAGAWTSTSYDIPPKEVANYLIKMHFQHAEYLPPHVQEAAVKAHRLHDQDLVDAITKKAQEAFQAGDSPKTAPPEWTDGLKPAKPYDAYLKSGKPASEWSSSAIEAFYADHQPELQKYAQDVANMTGYTVTDVTNSPGTYIKWNLAQAWLDDQHAKDVAAQMVPVWKKVDAGSLPSHGHTVWKATQTIPYTGESSTWFAKPAPDGKEWRLEQEHAANQIGKLFGFRTAESQILDGEKAFGQKVQVQRAIPGKPLGHHTDMPAWSQFTPQQVAEIAMEHLLDWVLANDDSSPNNMIKTPDGHIVGIDKGRSWGNFQWAGLAGDKSMDSMTQLIYTKLYDAVRSHELPKEVADQAYTAVIQKARKIAKVSDESLRQLLEQAFEHRTKWASIKDKQHAIEEILNRKNNLASAFKQMWGKVYQDAGFGGQPSDFGAGKPWGEAPAANARYGMVVFNDKGQVLLREVKGHYGATAWTFAKGGQHPSESPMQAAIREGAEETKYEFTPVGYVPGSWAGKTSSNYYYLGTAKDAKFVPEKDNGETEQTKWVSLEEAKGLIAQSESAEVRARDLGVLNAAAKEWGAGKYDAKPLADPHGLSAALPDVPEAKLPEAPGGHHLYAGFSEPGFTDHVTAAKGHGVPAFFGGPDLRDMHVLVWQKPDISGKAVTHGETFLKGNGYKTVIDWLKKHSGKQTSLSDDTTTTYSGGGMPGYAPTGSADRAGLIGERETYNAIIKVARSVTTHKVDGNYNAAKMADLEAVAKDLEHKLSGAETILANPGAVTPKVVQDAANTKDMAQHYLGLVAQVRAAKQGSYGFGEGDLPRWLPVVVKPKEPTEDELAKLGLKVTFGAMSKVDLGTLGDDHIFQPDGNTHKYSGKWWHVDLATGERIEIGDGDDTGVQLVHHGRVRFTTTDHSAASMERIRDALKAMGLSMDEAEEHHFEQFYWRHLISILDDRSDGHKGDQQKVWDSLQEQFPERGLKWTYGNGDNKHREIVQALATLGPEAEAAVYRRAFAKLTSEAQVADWAERGGFLPHLKHFDPNAAHVVGGKPDWYRFDLAAKVASLPPPIIQSSNSYKSALLKVKTGAHYSKDALYRIAGVAASGLSNPDDSGGPAYVFTRLHQEGHVMWSPLVLARSHNYAFSDDEFGRWTSRKYKSPWNPATWSKYNSGNNEHMISDALSLLDDLELVQASDETQRQELIKWLKDRGITHIRYMPVEDRIVTHIGTTAKQKVRDNWEAHPELLDPLREPEAYAGTQPATPKAQPATPKVQPASDAGTMSPEPTIDEAFDYVKKLQAKHGDVYSHGEPFNPGAHKTGWVYFKDSSGKWWVQHGLGEPMEKGGVMIDSMISTGAITKVPVLSTPAGATAADAGVGDPHVQEIASQFPDSTVYHEPDSYMYYVHSPDGTWHSFSTKDGGDLDGPYKETALAFVTVLNKAASNGDFTKVHEPSVKPDQGLSVPATWPLYQMSTGSYATKAPDGKWYWVASDNTFTTGIPVVKSATIVMDQQVSQGAASPASFWHGKMTIISPSPYENESPPF